MLRHKREFLQTPLGQNWTIILLQNLKERYDNWKKNIICRGRLLEGPHLKTKTHSWVATVSMEAAQWRRGGVRDSAVLTIPCSCSVQPNIKIWRIVNSLRPGFLFLLVYPTAAPLVAARTALPPSRLPKTESIAFLSVMLLYDPTTVYQNSFLLQIPTLQMFTDKWQINWCLTVLFLQSDESKNRIQ